MDPGGTHCRRRPPSRSGALGRVVDGFPLAPFKTSRRSPHNLHLGSAGTVSIRGPTEDADRALLTADLEAMSVGRACREPGRRPLIPASYKERVVAARDDLVWIARHPADGHGQE